MLSRYLSAACGLFAVLAACACETPRTEQVVLEVGGRPVSLGEFDRFVQTSVQQKSPVLSSEVMSALFDEFIEEQLLLRAADDAGIQADPRAVAKRVESLQRMDSAPPRPPKEETPARAKQLPRTTARERAATRLPVFATTARSRRTTWIDRCESSK